MNCPETTDNGTPCIKKMIQDKHGWFHGGGHVFASDAVAEMITRGHYDAGRLLALEQSKAHLPEDCPGDDSCPVIRLKL